MTFRLPAPHDDQDPTVAAANPRGWHIWLLELAHTGKQRLSALGLTLLLGFGVGVFALYLFTSLAEEVLERETEQLDAVVLAGLRQFASPTLDTAAVAASALGSEGLAVFLVLLLGYFVWRRRFGAVVALLLTTAGAQMLNNVLKDLFHRTRPAPVTGLIPAQAFSFPSGHAMVSAAFYFFLAYLGWRVLRGWQRTVWISALLVVVIFIGLSRLYLGVHYLTDVVAGYLAGFLWTDTVIVGGHLLARRRRPDPTAEG